MSGPPERTLPLLLSLLLLWGCDPEAETPPVSAQAKSAATASVSPTPIIPESVDISGCWREVDARNVLQPLGSPFQLIRIEPDAFVFEINPSRTKLKVKDYSFQEVNLDDKRPFFPKGTIVSAGGISQDLNQIDRTFTGEGNPRIYRRCEKVPTVYIPPAPAQPRPQATPSVLMPVPRITPLLPGPGVTPVPTPRPTLTPLLPATDTGPSPAAGSGFPLSGPLALPTPSPSSTESPLPEAEPPAPEAEALP